MLQFLLVICLFTFTYGGFLPELQRLPTNFENNGRIIGGEDADITEFPYQAFLEQNTTIPAYKYCGGAIIAHNAILSSAKCAKNITPDKLKVRVGSTYYNSGGQVIDVARIIIHSSFTELYEGYDISILILAESIDLNDVTTKAVTLPRQNLPIIDNSPAILTGWGATQTGGDMETTLQKVTVPTMNPDVCIEAFETVLINISRDMLCTGKYSGVNQFACSGDYGAPLVVDGVIVGITSIMLGCGTIGFPQVNTRVPAFRSWIDAQLSAL